MAAPPGRSAPKGEADEIGAKADVPVRMSAVGGKADVLVTWPGSPLLAEAVEKLFSVLERERMIRIRPVWRKIVLHEDLR